MTRKERKRILQWRRAHEPNHVKIERELLERAWYALIKYRRTGDASGFPEIELGVRWNSRHSPFLIYRLLVPGQYRVGVEDITETEYDQIRAAWKEIPNFVEFE